MSASPSKRVVRRAPAPQKAPSNAPPRVPGEESSKVPDNGRKDPGTGGDARHAHDKDGNEEARRDLRRNQPGRR